MAKPLPASADSPNRNRWAVLVFLVTFSAGVVALAYYYIFPALKAFNEAHKNGDSKGAKAISATSALLLAILLLILVAGILLTFRMGRLFFPRNTPPRTQTEYTDAWAESAKRMETPPEEE
jgi:uncharacterized membrane protein (UPF0182 family)